MISSTEIHAALKPRLLLMGIEYPEWHAWAEYMAEVTPFVDGDHLLVFWEPEKWSLPEATAEFRIILETTLQITSASCLPWFIRLNFTTAELNRLLGGC